MDKLEQNFINSPFKKIMLRFFEIPTFKRFATSNNIKLNNKVLLDAGCGRGYGLKLLYKYFQPKELYGIDILPREVQLAQQQDIPAKIYLRNLVDTKFESNKFDFVFIFTVLHHIPEWRQALIEINRILKPNGILFVDELNRKLVKFFQVSMGIKHPDAAQFSWDEFTLGVKNANFEIIRQKILLNRFGLFCCIKK